MKICVIHNEYGKISGEEIAVSGINRLLEEHHHEMESFIRSSTQSNAMRLGNIRAFFVEYVAFHQRSL